MGRAGTGALIIYMVKYRIYFVYMELAVLLSIANMVMLIRIVSTSYIYISLVITTSVFVAPREKMRKF